MHSQKSIGRLHNKDGYRPKEAKKGGKPIIQGRQFNYVAKVLKERMPLSYHQMCTH